MKILLSGAIVCALSQFAMAQKITKDYDSLRIEIEPLGMAINSSFDDYAPVITANGQEMFFTSRKPFTEKDKLKNVSSTENIYKSTYDPDTDSWSVAEALPAVINIPGKNNSLSALSKDGGWILVYQDSKGNGDIYESSWKGSSWTELKPLATTINSTSHETSATISPDEKTVYFISERPGGSGKKDIWQTTKYANGTWSPPRNLGKLVNSAEDEEAVYIHPDGKTLFFSSKGHNSIGGYDVYKTVYENDEWSKPVSLGEPVNTSGDDLFFVMTANRKKGFYATNRGSGDKNIYEVNFIAKGDKVTKMNTVKGTIKNKKTTDPMEAKIEIIDNEKNEVIGTYESDSETGKYLFTLPAGKSYGISITAPYFMFYSDNLSASEASKAGQIMRDIDLQKLEKGTKVNLKNIFFDEQSALKPESNAELNRIFQLMAGNPRLVIELGAHTDVQGDAAQNLKSSENKVKAIYDYLTGEGIPRDRIKYKGYGETLPVYPEAEIAKMVTQKQNEARAQNQRLELTVVSN